ncbi:hypothetical protein JQX13_02225 [Archangium violaceum]|uniref:hypothetical protein n=1 Tax=Archangium violaceum TaxID=83451 RepID=UPI00193C14F3|nr:hypothetical protein [Archangium violaceum]QRK09006.1 hypothetical protein JQX13_02225 [Archangium violaceum]
MSGTTHTRPPGSGTRQGEPTEGEGSAPPSLAPWEAPVEAPVQELVEEARGATTDAERAALAARINRQLDALAAGGGSREVADLLHHLLESGQLAGLVDAAGRSCRASATEALTRLGFPFALEVRPEDLDHLRGLDADAPGFRWAPLAAGGTLGAGIVAEWVLLLERGLPESDSLQPSVLLMGLSLLALVTGVLAPERSTSQRAGMLVLAILSVIQVFLGVFWGYEGAISGLAGLLACLLIWLPRR